MEKANENLLENIEGNFESFKWDERGEYNKIFFFESEKCYNEEMYKRYLEMNNKNPNHIDYERWKEDESFYRFSYDDFISNFRYCKM